MKGVLVNEGIKQCYASRGTPFTVSKDEDIFAKKDELHGIMLDTYYTLMEKYSTYNRNELEASGISLHEQWQTLKNELITDCDIPHTGYKLDLADEKLIGKAKVVRSVITPKEAFAHLKSIDPARDNAFLFDKRHHF